MRRRVYAAAAFLAALAVAVPAAAQMAQNHTVSPNPVDFTPNVNDGEVRAFALVGNTVVVGGDFHSVSDASRTHTYTRQNVFAYNLTNGAILPFAPNVDGDVLALAPGAGGSVYIGGTFKTVDGAAQRGLAQLNLADGGRMAGFSASINWGDVRSLISRGPWLYAAGSFEKIGADTRVGLARLNAATGGVDPNFDLHLTAPDLTRVKMEKMALTPDGTKLVTIGAVEQVAGQYRSQIFVTDTGSNTSPQATLSDWYTNAYTKPCRAGFETYLRGVDVDPTGSYMVVVSTGRKAGSDLLCDSAVRFELGGAGLHQPTWVNKTGGDSLYSVSVTGSSIYVGGHQRWMNNPQGHESEGPGAVERKGIAAIDPNTGLATEWNPERRPRGVGARALLAVPGGLLIGSDTENLGGEFHGRLGMFPL